MNYSNFHQHFLEQMKSYEQRELDQLINLLYENMHKIQLQMKDDDSSDRASLLADIIISKIKDPDR